MQVSNASGVIMGSLLGLTFYLVQSFILLAAHLQQRDRIGLAPCCNWHQGRRHPKADRRPMANQGRCALSCCPGGPIGLRRRIGRTEAVWRGPLMPERVWFGLVPPLPR